MTTDRNALIEAAARVLWRQACSEYDYEWDRNAGQFRREAAEVLDAVLPLIADAIDAELTPKVGTPDDRGGYDCCGCGTYQRIVDDAARLVRALAHDRPRTGE